MLEYAEVCERAARAGGAVLLAKMGRVEAREKGPADLVTEADFASQEAVRQVVQEAYPEHEVLGEEGSREHRAGAGNASAYRWVVDPLDGTTNYVHGVPHFCVSVALQRGEELLVGTVFDPVSGECFSAAAGQGAWLDGRPIRTSGTTTCGESLAAIGFPPGATLEAPDVRAFLAALPHCQSLRRTGSAALNLAYVAVGRFDASWSFSTRIWDIAAGILLIREAGGVASSPSGGVLEAIGGRFLVASTASLHGALCRVFADAGIE